MFLKVTDLKQYAYCPRIVYFQYVMPVDTKATFKMEYGKISEEQLRRLEQRRKFKRYGLEAGVRHFNKWVVSDKLKLSGKLDLLIEADRNYYPVDFKMTEGGVQDNHRLQLAGYALIIEDLYATRVEQGFVFLIAQQDVVAVPITDDLRATCHTAIEEMRRMVEQEWMPDSTSRRARCDDCEYRNYCRDIW